MTPASTSDREADVSDQNNQRQGGGETPAEPVVLGIVDPQGLEHRIRAVKDVNRKQDVGHDVDRGHHRIGQAVDDVGLDFTPLPVGVGDPAPRQVCEVEDQVGQHDHAGVAHAAGGEIGGQPVPLRFVCVVGCQVHPGEAVGGVDVEHEGADQAEPQQPQKPGPGEQWHQQIPEELAVDVDVVHHLAVVLDDAEVQLDVAEHVVQDKPEQHDAGDRHHPLLAHRRLVEVEGKRTAANPRPYRSRCAVVARRLLGGSGCGH